MDSFEYTVTGNRTKRNNSVGKFSGEENYTLSSNNNHAIQSLKKCGEPRKRATEIKQPRQKWRSLLDELSLQRSRAAVKNGRIESDGHMDRKPDNLMARELDRLHKLKLEVMRANDKRRRSCAGFGQERHRKSSVLGGHFPRGPGVSEMKARTSDNKHAPEAPRQRRITLTFPIESRDTLKLPQIQPLDLKAEQSRRVKEANRNHEGVEKMLISVSESKGSEDIVAKMKSKSKQDEHGKETAQFGNSFLTRYGSPLPQVNKPLEAEHPIGASEGPQITVSDYVDLKLRVKTFVKKPQPKPSEMSLRVARSMIKPPPINNAIKKETNKTSGEEAKHSKVVNTETCPSISFYEDRSWYYQDKRRKCRYLRLPDSPIPPIHSVFEKD